MDLYIAVLNIICCVFMVWFCSLAWLDQEGFTTLLERKSRRQAERRYGSEQARDFHLPEKTIARYTFTARYILTPLTVIYIPIVGSLVIKAMMGLFL